MKVQFNSQVSLGKVVYPKGISSLPDSIAHKKDFQAAVKSGKAEVLPRSEAEQKVQAGKDAHEVKKAASAWAKHKEAKKAI